LFRLKLFIKFKNLLLSDAIVEVINLPLNLDCNFSINLVFDNKLLYIFSVVSLLSFKSVLSANFSNGVSISVVLIWNLSISDSIISEIFVSKSDGMLYFLIFLIRHFFTFSLFPFVKPNELIILFKLWWTFS
jgi:hypothetical protein